MNKPSSSRLRDALAGQSGRAYWRSLDALASEPGFAAALEEEFPGLAAGFTQAVDRRHFLRLAGASLTLAGIGLPAGIARADDIVGHVGDPPGFVPGALTHVATATLLGGVATGVLVTHADAHPFKIEGNPDHPASLGATSAFDQAALLQLYDPDRCGSVTRNGIPASLDDAVAALMARARALASGTGLRILSGALSSPTLIAQRADLLRRFPEARWHVHEPAGRDAVHRGAALAFGRAAEPIPDLANTDIVLAVDSDLLSSCPGHLAFARAFAARRAPGPDMLRLYAIEATPTLTGAAADHRFIASPRDTGILLHQLAAMLAGETITDAPAWLAPLAQDLRSHHGRALLHVGPEQPAEIHALAHRINRRLVAPLRMIAPPAAAPDGDLGALVADMQAGSVDTLIVLGGNPAYTAPGALDFAGALARVPHRFHLAPTINETAIACEWVFPEAHPLEAWSDARAFDGTITILQPQIKPLHGGRSAHQILAHLLGTVAPDGRTVIRDSWRERFHGAGTDIVFDRFWTDTLRKGIVANSAFAPLDLTLIEPAPASETPPPRDGTTLLFRPDPAVWDGRFANSGWLQEMPRPLTTLTWDNAALVAPSDAERHGLGTGDIVRISVGDRSVEAPVWLMPGQAAGTITLPLGYGQARGGTVGGDIGFDAYRVRDSASLWSVEGAAIAKTGRRTDLAATQNQPTMAGRDLVREVSLAELADKAAHCDANRPEPSLYAPPLPRAGNQWGMAIDLTRCIGCAACVVACQAENNVPVVGRDEVRRGRAMHWLRIDRYYQGEPEQPSTAFQPVACMHCENAPCEVVCPVGATMHDHDGLNVMVYNRCVGTRFCSNNCPYKVRRFNFFDYAGEEARTAAARNPAVTVRSGGVMEKCTYCLQRIKTAEIAADRDGRTLADGDVVTACQAACPTRAISFGNVDDPASAVHAAKQNPLDYSLLGELNTRPRTTYTARLRNPNLALEGKS